MYHYVIGGKSSVVHMSHCSHIRGVDRSRTGIFTSLQEARKHGYRLCNHCAPINRFLNGHRTELARYCQENGLLYRLEDGCMLLEAPRSKWKIIVNGKKKKCIFLYHKNTYETGAPSLVPGYHSQAVRRESILGYLEYVNAHEKYRRTNPIMPVKQVPPPPQKGTKRWHKEQKHLRSLQLRNDMRKTLLLIDQLSVKNARTYR